MLNIYNNNKRKTSPIQTPCTHVLIPLPCFNWVDDDIIYIQHTHTHKKHIHTHTHTHTHTKSLIHHYNILQLRAKTKNRNTNLHTYWTGQLTVPNPFKFNPNHKDIYVYITSRSNQPTKFRKKYHYYFISWPSLTSILLEVVVVVVELMLNVLRCHLTH